MNYNYNKDKYMTLKRCIELISLDIDLILCGISGGATWSGRPDALRHRPRMLAEDCEDPLPLPIGL